MPSSTRCSASPSGTSRRCLARLEEAAAAGAELLVLPECAIPGYMFDSLEEGLAFAEEMPGPSVEALERECARLDMHVVCGLLERDGDRLRNAAVLVGPDGLIGTYWKTHLPFLGVDRFTTPGDEFHVWDTPLGRIGVEICYDLRFPEVTRTLALHGADLVAHPTNFPVAAKVQTEMITLARAAENRIYLLTANRVGKERTRRVLRPQPDRRPVRHPPRRGRPDRGDAARRRGRRREGARQGLRDPRRVRALPLRPPAARAVRRRWSRRSRQPTVQGGQRG